MTAADWQKMLKRWSEAIIASGEYSDILGKSASDDKWSGFPPANETVIAEAEQRLRLRLPESYRTFLKASNGWWLDGTDGPTRLWRVEEVRPMAQIDPETVAAYSAGNSQLASSDDSVHFAGWLYGAAIQISEDRDGRYLLNPSVMLSDHEWQAAFFANWVPGARCYDSFESLMKAKFDAFLAAHPSASKGRAAHGNLGDPPKDRIRDPERFLGELQRLGFFDLVSEQTRAAMIRDFHQVYQRFQANGCKRVKGPFPSPGSVLCDPRSGRVVDLDAGRLAQERGRYAIAALRPLLASVGVVLGAAEEQISEDAYGVTLEGIRHKYFRLRDGHPALPGGESESNAARYALDETSKLLNRVLAQRKSILRIASLGETKRVRATIQTRLALVVLDDALSYLLMWSPIIHNYCRPLRPDVL